MFTFYFITYITNNFRNIIKSKLTDQVTSNTKLLNTALTIAATDRVHIIYNI